MVTNWNIVPFLPGVRLLDLMILKFVNIHKFPTKHTVYSQLSQFMTYPELWKTRIQQM